MFASESKHGLETISGLQWEGIKMVQEALEHPRAFSN
jgi:hypothetical protein